MCKGSHVIGWISGEPVAEAVLEARPRCTICRTRCEWVKDSCCEMSWGSIVEYCGRKEGRKSRAGCWMGGGLKDRGVRLESVENLNFGK